MSDLSFVQDTSLRKKIEDSIEYIYLLHHQESKKEIKNLLFKEETNRVIILYIISVIEALFLYLYKNIKEKDFNINYKIIVELPDDIKKKKSQGRVVVAIREKSEKNEHELMLHALVKFFEKNGRLKKETVEKILKLNSLRNTFHLSKKRGSPCNTQVVENALKLLLYIIENISKNLKK